MKQLTLDGQAKSKGRRGKTFMEEHSSRFYLKVTDRNATTKAVMSVACRFCIVFGREHSTKTTDKPKKKTTNTKYFKQFRSDFFEKHLTEYQALTDKEDKTNFFLQPAVPFVDTLLAVFESEDPMVFSIDAGIVETIVGGMLFHPDDAGSDVSNALWQSSRPDNDRYKIIEKNPSCFRLCVSFLTNGSSFCMAAANTDATKKETGIGRFGGCSNAVVARYARIVCAVTHQKLSRRLSSVWTFSLALLIKASLTLMRVYDSTRAACSTTFIY